MLRPTVGELLEGVRVQLAAQVLPSVPAGAEARQLKAALHVLEMVAETWDREHTRLEADNADIDRTIEAFCSQTGRVREPTDHRAAAAKNRFPGVRDEQLRRLMARNQSLQEELEALQQRRRRHPDADPGADQLLLELHIRTTARSEGRNDSG
ncbi:hypothetical protein GCM10009613_52290 [Pseudonocardia kongjuensis]|uniref:Uncharacterized protein n=1 Tax=Pseudonocardia kongjuensis TaxID=102227 RepID=A0ABP4IT08_9PSEU